MMDLNVMPAVQAKFNKMFDESGLSEYYKIYNPAMLDIFKLGHLSEFLMRECGEALDGVDVNNDNIESIRDELEKIFDKKGAGYCARWLGKYAKYQDEIDSITKAIDIDLKSSGDVAFSHQLLRFAVIDGGTELDLLVKMLDEPKMLFHLTNEFSDRIAKVALKLKEHPMLTQIILMFAMHETWFNLRYAMIREHGYRSLKDDELLLDGDLLCGLIKGDK